MSVYGVDIAGSYQAGISIPQLKLEGNAFVVCKATEGTTYAAPHFAEWIPQIKDNHMVPGAYHYLRNSDGAAQCDWFLQHVTSVNGGIDGMMYQLDCEADASFQVIEAFFGRWNEKTNNYPIAFYTGDWWLQPRGWDIHQFTPYLWAAPDRGYTGTYSGDTSNDWQAGYGGYSELEIEQFTSKATAGGLVANVDANFIRDPAWLAHLVRNGDPVIVPISNPPAPGQKPGLLEDGVLGKYSISAWQRRMGTYVDGVITQPPGRSSLVKAVQVDFNNRGIRDARGARLDEDGVGIVQAGVGGPHYHTIEALERRASVRMDGYLDSPSSGTVRWLQHALNTGTY